MQSALADENFSHRIPRGIRLRVKNLDVVVAQSVGLCGTSDPSLLAWAGERGRIVLTHDRQTIPGYAYDRNRSHESMPGVIVVFDTMLVGEAIEALTMYLECSEPGKFENLVVFIP
jgi:hypothetical protein